MLVQALAMMGSIFARCFCKTYGLCGQRITFALQLYLILLSGLCTRACKLFGSNFFQLAFMRFNTKENYCYGGNQ